MLKWFRRHTDDAAKASELYGAVVAQARQPAFYVDYGVPDTQKGRYEMLVLVLFQVLERLKSSGESNQELSRMVLEALFTDVDDQMREIGIGDLSVPRKVKRAAAGFYERAVAYRQALEARDEQALARHMQHFIDAAAGGADRETPLDERRVRLAKFAVAQMRAFDSASIDDVASGRAFLPPAGFAGTE